MKERRTAGKTGEDMDATKKTAIVLGGLALTILMLPDNGLVGWPVNVWCAVLECGTEPMVAREPGMNGAAAKA
jgi:hypothetical protein